MAAPDALPELIRLSEAAAELGVKVSSLRTEIKRGRLRPVEIAGKFYLTRESLGEMIDACRVKPKDRDCTSGVDMGPDGLSSIRDPNVALDAARLSLQRLKEHSRAISRKNTSRAEPRDH